MPRTVTQGLPGRAPHVGHLVELMISLSVLLAIVPSFVSDLGFGFAARTKTKMIAGSEYTYKYT